MGFQLATSVETPTATTVRSYKLDRLGKTLYFTLGYAETIPILDNVGGAVVNDFGHAASRISSNGRTWELVLDSSNAAHMIQMQTMMVSIYFRAIKAFLTHVSNTSYSDGAIALAATEIAQGGVTIDDFITAEVEAVELARRSNTIHPVVMGTAP